MTLQRIALTLSGGGFRAAAFHLGVLRQLHAHALLGRVRALSTVSGGTLTGAFYAQSLARGLSFEEFDRRFYQFLQHADVIDAALQRMPGSGKLIVAAAQVYADTLFDGTLGEVQSSRDHLEEIAFNATDIAHGIGFRFIKSANRRVRSGNGEVSLPHDVAAGLRLADVVAASSCFPAAFEPMLFPSDFAGAIDLREVPLMDGGIYDNQGVDSLLLVRSRKRDEIDTIMVCDANVGALPLYEPSRRRSAGFVRVWMVAAAGAILELAALISIVSMIGQWRSNILPLLVSTAAALVLGWLAVLLMRLRRSPIAARPRPLLWRHLMRLTVSELAGAVEIRAGSLVALTARVFTKRVRTLTYKRLFERPSLSRRIVTNDLTDLAIAEEAGESMRALGARAASMRTTLWFDRPEQLRDIVACGEMSTCLNLLRYLRDHGGPAHRELLDRLRAQWDRWSGS